MGKLMDGIGLGKSNWNPDYSPKGGPPGFTRFRAPEVPMGNRPKNRKYPSKARTPLGG